METASNRSVGLGFAGGTSLSRIDSVRADVRWAANAGFDSYWVSFVAGVDPLVALAVAGAEVSGIELGTSVVPMAGRHPLALAQLARTTQQCCHGRFTLGVGPSHQPTVEGVYGESWANPFARTQEYLSILAPLCRGEAVDFDGEHYTAHRELQIPCPEVPIVLAALGPNMLELAGSTVTGTHVGQTGPQTIAEHTGPKLRAAAAAAGRPDPRLVALVNVCVTDDVALARQYSVTALANYGMLPSYQAMLEREDGVDAPEDLLLAGSIEDVAAGLQTYIDAGVTDLRIGIVAPDRATESSTRDALARWVAAGGPQR